MSYPEEAVEDGVLNKTTMTVHRVSPGPTDKNTSACGHTHHVEREQLERVNIDAATKEGSATLCGGCFRGEGGY